MGKNLDDANVDIRTLKLNISRGIITEDEYQNYLKSLPDLQKQADELPVYEEPEDIETVEGLDNLTFSAG